MAPAKIHRLSEAHEALWQRIESFSFDDPSASFPFSARLAKENRWPLDRAHRAIAEYKKFIFLGCVAGHPVSPSEDVDQVWHLHLTYSESYWKKWCAETLQRPFHHHPTRGGDSESAKFEDWYSKTLQSYERIFGEAPPIDIWPPSAEHHRLAWVNLDSHWVISKPKRATVGAAAAGAAALLISGCVGAGMNVFDYRGPDFLQFYAWFSVIVFAVAFFVRRVALSATLPAKMDANELDPYELAMIAGGEKRAVDAALVSMANAGIINVASDGSLNVCGKLSPTAPPLERHILEVCEVSRLRGPKRIQSACSRFTRSMKHSLVARSLMPSGAGQLVNILVAPIIAWTVPICGWIKVFVGLSRDRPVFYLVLLTILTTVIAAWFTRPRAAGTSAGRRLLRRARQKHANLKRFNEPIGTPDALSNLPVAVALFGLASISSSPYREPAKRMGVEVPPPFTGSASGCGGSGCSSSSDSGGGSSCGGGGGGGCGGCGGGGGD